MLYTFSVCVSLNTDEDCKAALTANIPAKLLRIFISCKEEYRLIYIHIHVYIFIHVCPAHLHCYLYTSCPTIIFVNFLSHIMHYAYTKHEYVHGPCYCTIVMTSVWYVYYASWQQ